MSTKFLSPGWRMPRNANQSKSANYSLNFDGGIQCVTASNFSGLANKNSGSFSLWFKTTNTTTNAGKCIFSIPYSGGDNGFDLYINNSTSLVSYLKTTTFTTTTTNTITYGDGNWHHVAVVYDGSTHKIYFDTVDVTNTSTPTPSGAIAASTVNTVEIGRFSTSYQNEFNGQIDGVSIFDYALSASQITTLYGTGSAIGNPMALPRTPIAYYPLGGSAAAFRTPVNTGDQWLIENNAIGDYVFDFDGSNAQNINCGNNNSLQATSTLTLSAWIKYTTNDSNYRYVLTRRDFNDNNYMFYLNNTTGTKTLKFASSGVATSSGSVTFNKWHHVAVTANGNSINFYIDGTSAGSSTITALNSIADKDFIIGDVPYSTSNEFAGLISNAQMFNTALSATEVETLYNYGSPIQTLVNIPQSSNLKAWYKLDASEFYNGTSTKWEVNQALSFWKNSVDFNLTDSSANRAYIQCANTTNLNLTGAMTISAWMKGDQISSGSYNGLGTQGNSPSRGYGLLRGTNNAIFSISDNGSNFLNVSSPSNTWLDGWNHIVGVFDPNSRFEVYVNGVFSASGTNYAQQTSTNPFQIGSRGDGSNLYNWLGQLSNVSIWNTALSNGGVSVGSVAGGEIATLYNGGEPLQDLLTGPQNSNLLSWWKLDNITTGIQDSKGTNNGTIVTLGNGSVSKFNQSVSTLNGTSSGMNQSNLVQSDLQTVAPYSKYAMNFRGDPDDDYIQVGTSDAFSLTDMTISFWFNASSIGGSTRWIWQKCQSTATNNYGVYVQQINSTKYVILWDDIDNRGTAPFLASINENQWYNVTLTMESLVSKMYLNGSSVPVYAGRSATARDNLASITAPFRIGINVPSTVEFFQGSISNGSVWDAALTPAQITEIYNQGLPSNLNSHSAYSNLVSWWQLGENSSFDGTNWICADEKGSNNGTSTNMIETNLTNGVGTTANGVSSGMAVGDLVGDAPYSTANAISSGMAVNSRGTDIPPTP